MPQKHPPATTTVAWPLALAMGSSTAGFGIATAALAPLQAKALSRGRMAIHCVNERGVGERNMPALLKRCNGMILLNKGHFNSLRTHARVIPLISTESDRFKFRSTKRAPCLQDKVGRLILGHFVGLPLRP